MSGTRIGDVPGRAPVRDGAPSARIIVKNLSKKFHTRRGDVIALDSVSLEVGADELVVLLGPSGCGKTTLLRCVAGLERPDEGEIEIHGTTVFSSMRRISLPPEQRRVSMVFQSYALWPHMTVFENIAYPLRNRRTPQAEVQERVQAVLETVGLGPYAKSYPGQLSGGQQQRVALARAIVTNDGVVLFDEPLSNVDAKVRERLRLELLGMQREFGFSALYVTHDQTEATALAHRIAVMNRATIAQVGSPREIYERPGSRYVADFIGAANEVRGEVDEWQENICRLQTPIGPVLGLSHHSEGAQPGRGTEVVALFRPEHLRLATHSEGSPGNQWHGLVERSVFLGSHVEYVVAVGSFKFLVRGMHPETIQEGSNVWLSIEPTRVSVLST